MTRLEHNQVIKDFHAGNGWAEPHSTEFDMAWKSFINGSRNGNYEHATPQAMLWAYQETLLQIDPEELFNKVKEMEADESTDPEELEAFRYFAASVFAVKHINGRLSESKDIN